MIEWTGKEPLPARRGPTPDWAVTHMVVVGVTGLAGAGKDTFAEGLLEAAAAAPDCETYIKTPLAGPLKWVMEGAWDLPSGALFTVEGKAGVIRGWEDPRAWIETGPPYAHWEAAHRVGRLAWREGELEQAAARADQVVASLRERFPDGDLPLRVAMQVFGTDICRAVRDTFWLDTHYEMMKDDETDGTSPGPFASVWVTPSGLSTSLRVVPDVRFDNEAAYVHSVGGIVVRVVRPGQLSTDTHASEAGVSDALVDLLVRNDGNADDLRGLGRALYARLSDVDGSWRAHA